jgi:hypothetical protein
MSELAITPETHQGPSYIDEKYDPEDKRGTVDDAVIAVSRFYFQVADARWFPDLHSHLKIKQEVAGAFFDDPNLDRDHIELENDSPYPEVRSAVANTDDIDMYVSSSSSI